MKKVRRRHDHPIDPTANEAEKEKSEQKKIGRDNPLLKPKSIIEDTFLRVSTEAFQMIGSTCFFLLFFSGSFDAQRRRIQRVRHVDDFELTQLDKQPAVLSGKYVLTMSKLLLYCQLF